MVFINLFTAVKFKFHAISQNIFTAAKRYYLSNFSVQSKLNSLCFGCLGESSQMEEEQAFSISAKSVNEEDQVQNVSTVLEAQELKRSKRRLKQLGGEGSAVGFDLKAVTTKQKLSIKSVGVSGTKTFLELVLHGGV